MAELSGLWGVIEALKHSEPLAIHQATLEAKGAGPANGDSYWPGTRQILDQHGITIGGRMEQEARDILSGQTKRSMDNMPPKLRLRELLNQNRGAIMAAMPQHMNPDRLLRVAQTACTSSPELLDCYVPSLLGGIMQAAQFGLEPNTPLGHCYLVPYRRNLAKRGQPPRYRKDCQLIVGYQGLIVLARRSGQIISISAHCVRAGDDFEWEYGLDEKLRHKPGEGQRGEITHAYAVAKLVGGGHAFEVLTRGEIDEVMLGTQSAGKWGPWRDRYEPMARKTAVRRVAKYLPMTVELATAAEGDSRTAVLGGDGTIESVVVDESILNEIVNADELPSVDATPDEAPQPEQDPPPHAARPTESRWPRSVDDGHGGSVWSDSAGESFDPSRHATGRDGRPAVVSDGRFRARRGAAKAAPPPSVPIASYWDGAASKQADAASKQADAAYDGPSVDGVMTMIRENCTDESCVADIQAVLTDMPATMLGKDQCVAALGRKALELDAQ